MPKISINDITPIINSWISERDALIRAQASVLVVQPQHGPFLRTLDAKSAELASILPLMDATQWEAFSELVYAAKNKRQQTPRG